MAMTTIEQIKSQITITQALEQYTAIKIANPNRRSISTVCPFHSDKNPSFAIYPNTNTFKCFAGCNDGRVGDVIDVVRLAEDVSFKEAIRILHRDFQLSGTRNKGKEQEKKIYQWIQQRICENLNTLTKLDKQISEQLAAIKTVEALDKIGNLYHLKVQIDYWLDCFIHESAYVKIEALEEVEKFLKEGRQS